MTRIVIAGGGFAGILAAARLGRARPDVETILVSTSREFVERVRFHQVAAGESVARHSIARLLKGTGAQFHQATITAIDPAARVVSLAGDPRSLPYDHLVYALGSAVDTARIPGVSENAMSLASVAAADAMADRLEALGSGARVAVCGGGLTGIELATEIADRFPRLEVALVTSGRFGAGFSTRAQAYLRAALQRLRVVVHEDKMVREVRDGSLDFAVGGSLAFDLCAWAASFAVPDLARQAGLATNDRGQILLDPFLRSISHPEIFGAGDAAIPENSHIGIRMGCATAMPMAAFATNNLLRTLDSRTLSAFRFAYTAQFVSLGRRDALAQYVRADDSPRNWISTGRVAAMLKELTFRMNLFGLRTGFYPVERMFRALAIRTLASPASTRLIEASRR